ncbi:MAG: DUF5752 family protein [Bacteroidota bacterium]
MNQFIFNTKLDQALLLGISARSVGELHTSLKTVPPSSIYYHTHRFLHQHHFLSPEPPNDFAYWIREVLNEQELGERLSSVDIVQFSTLEELRTVFLDLLARHIEAATTERLAPHGQEFYFMASRTFVIKTPYSARDLNEFKEALMHISINSIYYHIFDAKLRLEKGENDFSRWFRDLDKPALADAVVHLDPYTYTLEGLRTRILSLVERHGST